MQRHVGQFQAYLRGAKKMPSVDETGSNAGPDFEFTIEIPSLDMFQGSPRVLKSVQRRRIGMLGIASLLRVPCLFFLKVAAVG